MAAPDPAERYRARSEADPDDGRLVPNLVYLAKSLVAERPAVAVSVSRARRPHHALRRDTDVVIEGYPKSANGFVSHAFQVAQPRQIAIAHTTHAVGQLIAACRREIPALALIRQPVEAVSRIALVRPQISLELLLRGWLRFYRPLLPWRGRFALGPFPAVTSDLGAVMEAMNERLGTGFVRFEHTPENERAVFEAIGSDWATRIDPARPEHTLHSGSPSRERATLTARFEEKLRAPRYQRLLREAEEIHELILAS